jgi:hypothetical protein
LGHAVTTGTIDLIKNRLNDWLKDRGDQAKVRRITLYGPDGEPVSTIKRKK